MIRKATRKMPNIMMKRKQIRRVRKEMMTIIKMRRSMLITMKTVVLRMEIHS